jgi:hypothetical protein
LSLRDRIAKMEQQRGPGRTHVLFGRSHDDVQAQRESLIRAGTAAERDEFVMFVTIYEERPQ